MRLRLLAHPAFTGAVALLAVNDHVLKGRGPGLVTGKLSDVAGLFVVATVLALTSGRPRLGTCAAGLGFAAIKLARPAAVLAAPLLGGITRQDRTDLVALLALVPAHHFAARAAPARRERSMASVAVALVAVGAAASAVGATSCLAPPSVSAFVVGDDGMVFARIDGESTGAGGTTPAPTWAASSDGGRSWTLAVGPPPGAAVPSTLACTSTSGCFRVDGEQVEQAATPRARFATVFAFGDDQMDRMRRRAEAGCTRSTAGMFTAVAVVARPDGEHVIVAMGAQGALHRAPDGRWSRVAVRDRRPISLTGPVWLAWLGILAPVALFVLSPVPILVTRRGSSARRGAMGTTLAAAGAGALVVVSVFLVLVGVDYAVRGVAIAAVATLTFVLSVVVARTSGRVAPPPPPPGPPPPPPGAADRVG